MYKICEKYPYNSKRKHNLYFANMKVQKGIHLQKSMIEFGSAKMTNTLAVSKTQSKNRQYVNKLYLSKQIDSIFFMATK